MIESEWIHSNKQKTREKGKSGEMQNILSGHAGLVKILMRKLFTIQGK